MFSEELYRWLFDAAPIGLMVADEYGVITFINAQGEKLFGFRRGELIGRSMEILIPKWFQAAHPDFRARFVENLAAQSMGVGRDLHGLRKDKTEFPVEVRSKPFRSDGQLLVVTSVIDNSERQRNDDHIRLLMHELSHRSNNLLMVMLGIANQTVRKATSFSHFQSQFESRLMAIARCHNLLVEKGWTGALIKSLIFDQIKPFIDDAVSRVDAAGPPILLHPEAAQSLGLALHELTMNAIRYGALSTAGGRVVIRWDIDDGRLPRKFWLSWEERGGPRVSTPVREGFGHKLPTRIGSNSRGAGGLSFQPEGLNWRFECEEQIVVRR